MNGHNHRKYKVVLTFNLKQGLADEELRRSRQQFSFPNMLARQPGCELIELVKINDSQTMSVQTWSSEQDWWNALDAVKQARARGDVETQATDDLLESRDFRGGIIEDVISH